MLLVFMEVEAVVTRYFKKKKKKKDLSLKIINLH